MKATRRPKARKKAVVPEDRIFALFDLQARDWLDLGQRVNRATAFVMQCIVAELLATEPQGALRGFLGVAGHVTFAGKEFPERVEPEVAAGVSELLREALGEEKPATVARERNGYSLEFKLDRSRRKVQEWINEYVPPMDRRLRKRMHAVKDGTWEEWQGALQAHLHQLPAEYDRRRAALNAVHVSTREMLAAALEPALNEWIARTPHDTYEAKKELSKWVNAELRQFGLAVKCPQTGTAKLLMANPGSNPALGRILLDRQDESGKHHHTVLMSNDQEIPPLSLMPDDLERVPWGKRTGRQR